MPRILLTLFLAAAACSAEEVCNGCEDEQSLLSVQYGKLGQSQVAAEGGQSQLNSSSKETNASHYANLGQIKEVPRSLQCTQEERLAKEDFQEDLTMLLQAQGRAISSMAHKGEEKGMQDESVPFYMFDPRLFSGYVDCNFGEISFYKLNIFPFVVDALSKHKWRTTAENASVCFIPVAIDYIARGRCGDKEPAALNQGGSWKHTNPKRKTVVSRLTPMVDNMTRAIASSGLCVGKRLLYIAEDWVSAVAEKMVREKLPNAVMAKMEGPNGDCSFGVGYTTFYTIYSPVWFREKQNYPLLPNVGPRVEKYFIEFTGSVDGRHGYKDRAALFKSKGAIPGAFITTASSPQESTVRNCSDWRTDHDRCSIMVPQHTTQIVREQSTFSLTLRGDTIGSDRWQNAISAGSIPVYVGSEEELSWLPFQQQVPWKDIVVVLDRTKFQNDPVAAINGLRKMPLAELKKRQSLIARHWADVDWSAPESRLVDNILKEAASCQCKHFADADADAGGASAALR